MLCLTLFTLPNTLYSFSFIAQCEIDRSKCRGYSSATDKCVGGVREMLWCVISGNYSHPVMKGRKKCESCIPDFHNFPTIYPNNEGIQMKVYRWKKAGGIGEKKSILHAIISAQLLYLKSGYVLLCWTT